MTRADTCLFEHVVARAVVVSILPVSLSSCDRTLMGTSAYGSSEQAIGDVPRCLVQKRIVCFVLALKHGPACCSHLLLVGPTRSCSITKQKRYYHFRSTILMNTDANHFAKTIKKRLKLLQNPTILTTRYLTPNTQHHNTQPNHPTQHPTQPPNHPSTQPPNT